MSEANIHENTGYDTDKNITGFATEDMLHAGSIVRVDDGFTCMKDGTVHEVKRSKKGELYIECDEGEHAIAGQNEGGVYIGLFHTAEGHLLGNNNIFIPGQTDNVLDRLDLDTRMTHDYTDTVSPVTHCTELQITFRFGEHEAKHCVGILPHMQLFHTARQQKSDDPNTLIRCYITNEDLDLKDLFPGVTPSRLFSINVVTHMTLSPRTGNIVVDVDCITNLTKDDVTCTVTGVKVDPRVTN